MLICFYKLDGKTESTTEIEDLKSIETDAVIWIDLYNPTEEERNRIEKRFSVELFTRQEAEEIESSSRYFENEEEINANLNYIYRNGERYAVDPVSFILKNRFLITQRNIPLRSFEEVKRYVRHSRKPSLSGYHIFLSLFETRIDIEADFLEDLSKKIYEAGKHIALDRELEEQALIRIYNFQELTILFRETTSEIKRLFSSILRSEYFPKDEYEKIRVLIKDADSLLGHTAFNFERLEYLQNTFIGLVDMEQNKIIKIFTVMAVVFMPPTLIASIYGMNFHFMPELDWRFGYPFALILMVCSSMVTLLIFWRKRWL
jgi:magnesium transporter